MSPGKDVLPCMKLHHDQDITRALLTSPSIEPKTSLLDYLPSVERMQGQVTMGRKKEEKVGRAVGGCLAGGDVCSRFAAPAMQAQLLIAMAYRRHR